MTQEVMIQIFESDFNNDGLIQTVNARDLHEALGVGWKFADWIKEQLQDFKENQDYVIFSVKTEKMGRGRPLKDYALTLDAAKHICMMSRCEKGKQLRQYFIEVEKQFRLGHTAAPQQQTELIPGTPEHFNKCFTECFTQAYSSYFGKPAQTALTDQQQHTEPVEPVEEQKAIAGPALKHVKKPKGTVSQNDMHAFVSNDRLLEKLMDMVGLEMDHMHDPVRTPDNVYPMDPFPVYDKKEVCSMLKAAQKLCDELPASPKGYKRGRLFGIDFTMKREIKNAKMWDGKLFDAAYALLKMYKAEEEAKNKEQAKQK